MEHGTWNYGTWNMAKLELASSVQFYTYNSVKLVKVNPKTMNNIPQKNMEHGTWYYGTWNMELLWGSKIGYDGPIFIIPIALALFDDLF